MARYENNLFNKDFFMDEKPVRRSRIHWHSYYEAEFCLGGKGTQRINGVCDTIEKGVLTFLSPKDFHSIEAMDNPLHMITFRFFTYVLSPEMINLINEYKPPFRLFLEGEDFDKMLSAYRALEAEDKRTDTFRERALKYRIGLICLDIIRHAVQSRTDKSENEFALKETESFDLIVEELLPFIDEHLSEPLTRDEMAERIHLNPAYFSELFKKRLGISYSEYLINLRMSQAVRLLKYSDKSIVEIMNEVGYSSPSAFYNQFKKYYRILPGDVKRHERENE